jgi:hypothetical protein
MNLPGISCYCSTYGRPKILIENSIQCFLEQDWAGPKELVILNDFDKQELIFNHPEVKIINTKERIKPLGKKFNENISLCKYDLLATWEDDDIFLRNRLTYSYNNMCDDIFHTHDAFFEKDKFEIIKSRNIFHSTHMFSRELFNNIGKYNDQDSCDLDIAIMEKFKNKIGNYSQDTKYKDIFYIYVWSGSQSYHGSGWGTSVKNISEAIIDIVNNKINNGEVETGQIALSPKLRYNFYKYLPNSIGE